MKTVIVTSYYCNLCEIIISNNFYAGETDFSMRGCFETPSEHSHN